MPDAPPTQKTDLDGGRARHDHVNNSQPLRELGELLWGQNSPFSYQFSNRTTAGKIWTLWICVLRRPDLLAYYRHDHLASKKRWDLWAPGTELDVNFSGHRISPAFGHGDVVLTRR
jgi:hypothetical protein